MEFREDSLSAIWGSDSQILLSAVASAAGEIVAPHIRKRNVHVCLPSGRVLPRGGLVVVTGTLLSFPRAGTLAMQLVAITPGGAAAS